MVEALASVHDDVLSRLDGDPRFVDFIDRVIVESLKQSQREKVDYYARLLRSSAPAHGPDEAERIRLLDALDDMRLHHLRLFRAVASTEDVPAAIEVLGDVWETIRHVAGVDPEAAQRDWAILERLQLVDVGGWPSTSNLRLRLSDFGLRFELFVSGGTAPSSRWAVEVVGNPTEIRDIAALFARSDRDPRVARVVGGFYVTSKKFDGLHDPKEVFERAEGFLSRIRAASVLDRGIARPIEVRGGRTIERRDGSAVTHSTATRDSDDPAAKRPAFPRLPIEPIAEQLMARSPEAREALQSAGPEYVAIPGGLHEPHRA